MIYEFGTGGDINLKNEDVETVQGITNQVYLALFGGNIEESTSLVSESQNEKNDWFGNFYLDTEHQFNSTFERTINKIALTSGGISTLIDAAKTDLKYLQGYADIEISGLIPSLNKFELIVQLTEPNKKSTKITFIWDGTRKEIIETITI